MYVGKKAMNTIEGPVQPFIQKDPPRFYKTKKHWQVDVGNETISKQATNTQLFDGSILSISRDRNQNMYGQNSYTPKVNKNFRPPLLEKSDLIALSRLERPRTQARINPISDAQAQNGHGTDVSSFIDQRVMTGAVRPNINIGYHFDDGRLKDFVIPDLQFKTPQVQGKQVSNPIIFLDNEQKETDIYLERNNPSVFANAKVNNPYLKENETPLEDIMLDYNGPKVQGKSGMNNPFLQNAVSNLEDLILNNNGPQVQGKSGMNNPFLQNSVSNLEDLILNYNKPQVGVKTQREKKIETFNEPQVIRTINPIQLDYSLTKDLGIKSDNISKTPAIKKTLQFNRNVESSGIKPMAFQPLTPKLKAKK